VKALIAKHEASTPESSTPETPSTPTAPRSPSPSAAPGRPAPTGNPAPGGASEKSKLHAQLRAYEKTFAAKHGRQVASFADIRPVADLYRRYKELMKGEGGTGAKSS
jgi:hypothetical protein